MASKTKYNIVVGAKLDPTNNLSEQIQSAISKTTYKINIDVAYLTEQINKALKSSNWNIGGGSGGSGGGDGGGGGGRTYKGELNPETSVVHSLSTTTYFDEENKEIKELITGYDALGHKVTELNRIYEENEEQVRQRLSSTEEEGSLANKNAETYQNLSSKIAELGSNASSSATRVAELEEKLNQIKKGTDEFEKQKQYKELAIDIKKATNETRQLESAQKKLETQTQKNQQTFNQLSNRLNNLKSNGQITTKQFEKLRQELEATKHITDQTQLQAKLKEIGQSMSDSSKHAMTFGQMLKTAYEKFANFTPKIATSYRNVC